MAFWSKKKKGEDPAENEAEASTMETTEDVKEEKSDLDLIKEAMQEAKEERSSNLQQQAAEATNTLAQNDMPTEEEIRHAQEILARAQATQGGAKVGTNAPVNFANLKAAVNNFAQAKNQQNLQKVMECLQNPQTMVCVPANIITSKENEEKMKQGGEVKLEGPLRINPIILTDNTGKKVFPIFSGEDVVPDELKKKSPKVNMPIGECLKILKSMKDVDTLALDPYTANIRIGVNIEEKPKNA